MSQDELQGALAKYKLQTPEQIRALGAPATHDVFLGLLGIERGSIADIAVAIGKSPHALYHHMEKLVDVGLILVDGERRKGARTETLYRPVAHMLCADPDNKDPQYLEALVDNAVAQSRRAGNAIKKAHEKGQIFRGTDEANHLALQVTVRLNDAQRRDLLDRINQLVNDIAEQSGTSADGDDLLVTLSVVPKL